MGYLFLIENIWIRFFFVCFISMRMFNISTRFHSVAVRHFCSRRELRGDGKYWFDGIVSEQLVASSSSNTLDKNWRKWSPPVYKWHDSHFGVHVPSIIDNTEGIGGFHDLFIPSTASNLLDIGGGKSDGPKKWLEHKYPELSVYVVDPFMRTQSHNAAVQKAVETAGGADVTTSISVLNVIEDVKTRIAHCDLVFHTLKPGGIAYFKVWAGMWPMRGTGKGYYDSTRNVFQANAWAHAYQEEVVCAFGRQNVIVDNNRNLIVAFKN